MRSTFLLLDDIAAQLEKDFKGHVFDNKTGVMEPNIWIGGVPPKRSGPPEAEKQPINPGDPPYILIKYLGDVDTGETGNMEASIGILCAVYSLDSYVAIKNGYKDVLNMADRVLLTLLSRRYWDDNHWWLGESQIKRVCGLDREGNSVYEAGAQAHPIYGAMILATFKAAAIPRKLNK